MAVDRTLKGMIERIIDARLTYLKHYIAQVSDVYDPEGKGRVRVIIPYLNLNGQDQALWVVPRDKKALITPAVGDWVEIYFMNGDRTKPVYMGMALEMRDMLPENYDGMATTQVIFEANDNSAHIAYDELTGTMEIGNSSFSPAARKDDATISDASIDSTFWIWIAAVHAFIGLVSTALSIPFTVSAPTSQTGKINAGSSQVTIGDKQ